MTAKKIADPMDFLEENTFSDLKTCLLVFLLIYFYLFLKLEDFYKNEKAKKKVPAYHFNEYN